MTVTETAKPKPAKGNIQSLERAAALLDAVAAGGEAGASLTEMAEATGLHSSTVFHLTKTLEKLGFLARIGGGKSYFIGPRLFSLGAGAPQMQYLSRIGQPILDRLSAQTGEASHLAVRSGHRINIIARADAQGMLQISKSMGQVRPIHATAIGKILLSRCPEGERDAVIDAVEFEAFTPDTITDKQVFRDELARVAARGYAEDGHEFDPNIRCVAIAMDAFAGRLPVALGLSGPVWRMDDAAIQRHVVALNEHAADLVAALDRPDPA